MEKVIIYSGQQAKVACDEKCNKAWGINNRPKFYLELGDKKIFGYGNKNKLPNVEDDNNYAYLSDDELGEAPQNPRTYEDGQPKPVNKEGIPNKWCVRECERCAMSEQGKHNEPLELTDFSKRIYNINQK